MTQTTVHSYPQGGATPSYDNGSYQAPEYPAVPPAGLQYPPQTGYQQTTGKSQKLKLLAS